MVAIPPNAIELEETLSEKEELFEKWRNTIGLFLGPLLALAVYLTDMPSLSPKAHTRCDSELDCRVVDLRTHARKLVTLTHG